MDGVSMSVNMGQEELRDLFRWEISNAYLFSKTRMEYHTRMCAIGVLFIMAKVSLFKYHIFYLSVCLILYILFIYVCNSFLLVTDVLCCDGCDRCLCSRCPSFPESIKWCEMVLSNLWTEKCSTYSQIKKNKKKNTCSCKCFSCKIDFAFNIYTIWTNNLCVSSLLEIWTWNKAGKCWLL